jgi:hypothetical protein
MQASRVFEIIWCNLRIPKRILKMRFCSASWSPFAVPLHEHLAKEPQTLLGLSRFCTSENHFDLATIAIETGKKTLSIEFAFNVFPMFLLNMEIYEFEDGMWQNFPAAPTPVRWIMRTILPLWNAKQWKFMSCSNDGQRKRLAV